MKPHRFYVGMFLCLLFLVPGYGQYPNYQVNHPLSTRPEEVTIALNQTNPANLAAGANISFYYFSFDSGKTWTQGRLSSSYGVWGDPCVTFDPEGNLYFAHLSNPGFGYWIDRIVVQKSTDGGRNWSDGVGVGFSPPKNQDKEWLVADPSDSPYHGNLYMAWTEFDDYGSTDPSDSSRIRFSRSMDYGETWSSPVVVSDVSGNCVDSDSTVEGAVPAVGPHGEVYLSWAGPHGLVFDKSLDGGLTFGRDIVVAEIPGGWDFRVSGIYRCNGMPVTLCDISPSPYRGTVYIVWSDQRNGSENTDVFLIKSRDRGQTWSDIKRVNDDQSARHQFFHWATIDPSNGYLYVVFYDRRNTRGDSTEVYVARSTDGGETFFNFKVSACGFIPNENVFFGDYINIAALNGRIYPIWTRMDGTKLSVWVAIIDETSPVVISEESGISPYSLAQNQPNPFNATTRIGYRIGEPSLVKLSIFNLAGGLVDVLAHEYQVPGEYNVVWDASDLPSGIYFYHLESRGFVDTKKCLLVK